MSLSRAHTIVLAVALSLVLLIAVVLGFLGVPIWITLPLGLLVAGAASWWLLSSADDALLNAWQAQPLEPGTNPTVDNIVDGLCASHGFESPRLYVVDAEARNSAVLAGQRGAASIVFTSGLLESIDRIETEALLAHQLWVSRENAVADATLGARLVHLAPSHGLRRALRDYVLGDADLFGSDWGGVQLTRYPPGLVSVYRKMMQGSTSVELVRPDSAHLWLDDPGPAGPNVTTPTHPALEDRVTYLQEL